MDEPYVVIARRYRPQTFAEVIGQDAIIRTLQNALQSGRISHAYLFAGSRGTGKTSIARLYAKALNCTSLLPSGEPCNSCSSCLEITEGRSLDVQEIDGASHRGIDHIRSLTESASYAPTGGRYKIFLIDEVHMLTKEAFNALLKTLEEPPPSVLFFLATTEPHKIPTTIISRCQRFNLKRPSKEAIVTKLQRIVHDMDVQAEEGALVRIAGYADGGFRDAESLLDQVITFSDGAIKEETIEEVLGIAPVEWLYELDRAISTADISVAYTISDRVFHEGKDISHFIDDLNDHYRSLLLLKLRLSSHAISLEKDFGEIAHTLSQEHLIELLNLLADAQRTLKSAASQRFLLEWLLLSIVRVQRKVPLPLIARKLFELQSYSGGATKLGEPDKAMCEDAKGKTLGEEQSAVDSSPVKRQQVGFPAPSAPEPSCDTATCSEQIITPQEEPSFTEQAVAVEIAPPRAPTPTPIPKERKPKKTGGSTLNSAAKATALPKPEQPCAPSALPPEQEAVREENLIQFTAAELGATITKNP